MPKKQLEQLKRLRKNTTDIRKQRINKLSAQTNAIQRYLCLSLDMRIIL